MNVRSRVLIFGTVSGLIWLAVMFLLGGMMLIGDVPRGEWVTMVMAGILTGLSVSFVLRPWLIKVRALGALVAGAVSLPLGAFLFGVIVTLVQGMVLILNGPAYAFVDCGFHPLVTGFIYAALSSATPCGYLLYPLAIITTFGLRAVVRSGWQDAFIG